MRFSQKLVVASLCALALAAPAARAHADGRPAGGPNREAVKKAAEERKEAVKEKVEDLKEKRDERRAERGDAGESEHAGDGGAPDKLRVEWAKLRETRRERRHAEREAIRQKWGTLADHPAVKAELKVHAWRMARLKRIRAVADAQGKTATVARVDSLIAKENERYQKHMDVLQKDGGAK